MWTIYKIENLGLNIIISIVDKLLEYNCHYQFFRDYAALLLNTTCIIIDQISTCS